MNKHLSPSDLLSLEEYAEQRLTFRAHVMEHKKKRQLTLNQQVCLHFENHLTIQYQVQEVLQQDKINDKASVEQELEAYKPLIPDGTNLKATFLLDVSDSAVVQQKVLPLCGIENKVWLQVEDCERSYPIVYQGLERDEGINIPTVQLICYEFSATMIAALQNGAKFYAGIEHPQLRVDKFEIAQPIRDSLVDDFAHVNLN